MKSQENQNHFGKKQKVLGDSMEVIVSCMNKDSNLYKTMNLSTNAIIINQVKKDAFKYEKINFKGSNIKFFSMPEVGVGLSRNNGLMRAEDEILIIADEDEVFVNDYEDIIKKEYERLNDADMIVFNVRIHQNNKVSERVKKNGRVRKFNSLKYGAVTFTFKRTVFEKKRIYFSQLFGGGTQYGSGEDSLFIMDALKRKCKVYSSTKIIADVYNDSSSWFTGYNQKFFEDKGALYYSLFPNLHFIFSYAFLMRRSFVLEKFTFHEAYKLMLTGAKKFKNN
ncbi:hypothetical protein [Enterococcus gallinarum]|uniref:hypothetical protein n=1 Tax=Enterococcus gallinarum TaxID=1353 RepID=UPI0012E2A5A2|nr:hypothetical protein [Enterococcus gallinarum]MUO32342.1 hypothetical protein [Enterococcus gallinarum]